MCSRVTRSDPALQDTGSAYGWPRQLFGFAAVRGATTPTHLRPQGTEGRTAYRAHVQDVTALSYTTFEIQGMRSTEKPFTAAKLAETRAYLRAASKEFSVAEGWLGFSPTYLIYNTDVSTREEALALLTELEAQGFLERAETWSADAPRYVLAGRGAQDE